MINTTKLNREKGKPGENRGRKAKGSKMAKAIMIAWLPNVAYRSLFSLRGRLLR
ncbi:hypothetical protein SDC9_53278 [bioreactor metagenome]|uniref:Uncharacterized protein n=1 Tax=bioreactor metagenome TaxID=1076179 RepID=A0A644WY56_9ZZZZ